MRKITTISLLLVVLLSVRGQQQIGFRMPDDVNKIEMPFEEINNLVVIPIVVNRFLKLNFIVDTGVETSILTEPAFAKLLNVDLFREIVISGVGINDSIRAFVAKGIQFDLQGGIVGKNLKMIVLEDDFLKLSERMGSDVHGIIGYDLFKHFVVQLNYLDKKMTLHRRDKFKPRRRMRSLDLEIKGSKPYINAALNDSLESVNLMIDSGASHAMLIDPEQTDVPPPEKTLKTRLGTGLGGEINGKLGRFKKVEFAEFAFEEVLVSIPNNDAYSKLIKRGARQGTIGGELLSRLNPVFDYANGKVYFSRNKIYKRGFEADMSGLDLVVKGRFLDTLYVDYVRPNSPADEADIREGDVILSINYQSLKYHKFKEIQAMLKARSRKKLRVRLLRDDEKIKKEFRLRRQI